jgi:hypothetical protein
MVFGDDPVDCGAVERHIARALVRPQFVSVAHEVPQQKVQVLLARDNKVIQAPNLQRLHDPFDECVHVWGTPAGRVQ